MKKIGLICLALVLALGALGVGYAMWSKTLAIDATVNTGEVNAEFRQGVSSDPGTQLDPRVHGAFPYDPATGEIGLWYGATYDKHVATTECNIDPDDPQILHVTITGAYPCYYSGVAVRFRNTGTIPLKVQSLTVTPTGTTVMDLDGNGVNDVTILTDNLLFVGNQIEPDTWQIGSIWFHVEQTDPPAMNATYTFDFKIELVQWNEYEP